MGKGDQKTRRGKLFSGSYGVLRPRKRTRPFSVTSTTKKNIIKPEISKAGPKPKAAHKSKPEPVNEEVKPVAEEVKPVAEEVKLQNKEPKAATGAVKAASDEKKPAAKKETSRKESPK
jgi:ribosomal small subunit protein bTHX